MSLASSTIVHDVVGVTVQASVFKNFISTQFVLKTKDGREFQFDAFSEDPLPVQMLDPRVIDGGAP